ncbi:hypothetical protein ACFLU8_03535 [Chloroflexota bacterium]
MANELPDVTPKSIGIIRNKVRHTPKPGYDSVTDAGVLLWINSL